MKNRELVGLVLFLIGFSACDNSSSEEKSCFQVRVIEEICSNAVLQVVDPASTKIELQSWRDWKGNTYKNVFTTTLPCNVDQSLSQKGAEFFIEIIQEAALGECIQCMAILTNTPETFYNIRLSATCD